jgi:cell division protein FtsZ
MDKPQVAIKAIGVGGGGCNTINRAITVGVRGLEFVAVNTDSQALQRSLAPSRLLIGEKQSRGLGAGGDPAVGQRAAEESAADLQAAMAGADIVFIAAGMGGGTGTGAAPVIAKMAMDQGSLTIGVVTKPFVFEGNRRRRVADEGAALLRQNVDTLITVPNEQLLMLADKRTTLDVAFALADDVLRIGIQGITDTITMPGLINLDLSDIRSVMAHAGNAFMAIGRASGDERASGAALQALASPLLEASIEGARTILLNITGADYTLLEVQDVVALVQKAAAPDADIILGAVIDETMRDELQVLLVATALDEQEGRSQDVTGATAGTRLGQLRGAGVPTLPSRQLPPGKRF